MGRSRLTGPGEKAHDASGPFASAPGPAIKQPEPKH